MRVSVLYRIASVLLLLFAIGHTFGFTKTDPKWGVEALVGSMRSIHFDAQGFSRSYWDFFVGFGLFVSVFFLFSAVLAWQLGGIRRDNLASMPGIAWAFAVCFVAVAFLSWRFFFAVPIIFSVAIALCLSAAAWFSHRSDRIRKIDHPPQ
jgi:hypothetical protein